MITRLVAPVVMSRLTAVRDGMMQQNAKPVLLHVAVIKWLISRRIREESSGVKDVLKPTVGSPVARTLEPCLLSALIYSQDRD